MFDLIFGGVIGVGITFLIMRKKILDLEDEIAMIKMAIEMHNKKHLECEGKRWIKKELKHWEKMHQ